jgi:mono/diheme cytochrome c family protein
LTGSSWVTGPEHRLIKILLHGVRGPIEVAGRTYNREMPGFGQVMTDAEIASLASFVRGQFGGSSPPVEPAAVRRARAAAAQRRAPWTAEELLEGR